MFSFQVDARDNFSASKPGQICNYCCADEATVVPGEKNPWTIDYSPWLIGISGRGLCQPISFSIAKISIDPPAPFPSTLPPSNTDYNIQIAAGVAYSGNVSANATSPQSSPLTYKLDPLNPPVHGVVAMNSDGTYVYSPTTGYIGLDQFGFYTMDGVNAARENVVNIGVDRIVSPTVGGSLPPGIVLTTGGSTQVYLTPIPPSLGTIYVDPSSLCIRNPLIKFNVVASPELIFGQVYRLTVAASAIDCDGNLYRHISTYDILVTKCGF